MTENPLNHFNEMHQLTGETKIYWRPNYNYTSKLWEKLNRSGWTMRKVRSFVEIYNKSGEKVVSEIGIFHALKELAYQQQHAG